MRFGIIAALEPEARVFHRTKGKLFDGDEYSLTVCGPGRENAARAADQLIRDGCATLLSWGVAGALRSSLLPGDLIVGASAMTAAGQVLAFDEQVVDRIVARLGDAPRAFRGTVITVGQACATARDKADLHHRFGADAVDLESSGIAHVARSAGRGYVCIRAVVDAAGFEVPAVALKGLDRNGKLKVLRTLRGVIENPRQIPQMIRLANHFRQSINSLEQVARRLAD